MSCMVMNQESLAALANAVEARLEKGYNYWGFDAPSSLCRELRQYQTGSRCSAEDIYRKLYALNIRAYNGRYKDHQESRDEEAPVIDGRKYIIHHRPEYQENHFAVCAWHYQLAKLLDFWIYQTAEVATHDDPLRMAMEDFRDSLYYFIVNNSPPYIAAQWGKLPTTDAEEVQKDTAHHIYTMPGKAKAQNFIRRTFRIYTPEKAPLHGILDRIWVLGKCLMAKLFFHS